MIVLKHLEYNQNSSSIFKGVRRKNDRFIGQKKILRRIHQRLVLEAKPGYTSSYALYGLGGIGKTQIAIQYAHIHRAEFEIVYWLRSDDYETLVSSYVQVAQDSEFISVSGLDLSEENDHEEIACKVRAWFENTQNNWLLVFDNADKLDLCSRPHEYLARKQSLANDLAWTTKHGDKPADLNRSLGALVPRGSRGCVLVTSRDRSVDGQMASSGEEVREMSQEDAECFLLSCSRASQDQTLAASELVRTLGHLPLAIEHAGGYMRENGISIAEFRRCYESFRPQVLLEGLTENAGEYYERTIVTTWNMAFDAIDQEDHVASKLLRIMALLDGKQIQKELFTKGISSLPTKFQLSSTSEWVIHKSLSRLLSYSLVRPGVLDDTLEMHLLVQQVICDGMATERSDWLTATLQLVASQIQTDDDDSSISKFLAHARLCVERAVELNIKNSDVSKLLEALGDYLSNIGQNVEAIKYYERLIKCIDARAGVDSLESGPALIDLASAAVRLGKYQLARDHNERALEIYRAKYGAGHRYTTYAIAPLARVAYHQGKYDEALSYSEELAAIYTREYGPDSQWLLSVIQDVADIKATQGHYTEAMQYCESPLSQLDAKNGKEHLHSVRTVVRVGQIQQWLGRYDESLRNYETALKIREREFGIDNMLTGDAIDNIAYLYLAQGKYHEAIACTERVLAISDKYPDHFRVVRAYACRNLGEAYLSMHNYESALPWLQKSFKIYCEHIGEHHQWTAKSQILLGRYYHYTKKFETAKPFLESAKESVSKAFGPWHINSVLAMEAVADFQLDTNGVLEAVDTLTRVLKIYDDVTGPGNIRSTVARHYLGKAYAKKADHREAIVHFSQTLNIIESRYGRDHILAGTVMKDLAASYMETGRMKEAKELLTRVKTLSVSAFGEGNRLASQAHEMWQEAKGAPKKVTRTFPKLNCNRCLNGHFSAGKKRRRDID